MGKKVKSKSTKKTLKIMHWTTFFSVLATIGVVVGLFFIPSIYSVNLNSLPKIDNNNYSNLYNELNTLLDDEFNNNNYNLFNFRISSKKSNHNPTISNTLSDNFLTGYMTQEEVGNNLNDSNLKNKLVSDIYSDNNLWNDINNMLYGSKATLLDANNVTDQNDLYVNYKDETMKLIIAPEIIISNVDNDHDGYHDAYSLVHIAQNGTYNYQVSYSYKIGLIALNEYGHYYNLDKSFNYEYNRVFDRNLYQILHMMDDVYLNWDTTAENNATLMQSIVQTYYHYLNVGDGEKLIYLLDGTSVKSEINLDTVFGNGAQQPIEYDNRNVLGNDIYDSLIQVNQNSKDQLKDFNQILGFLGVNPLTISNDSSGGVNDVYSGYAPEDIQTDNSGEWNSVKHEFHTKWKLEFADQQTTINGDWTQKSYNNPEKSLDCTKKSNFFKDSNNTLNQIASNAGGTEFSGDPNHLTQFESYINNTNNYKSSIDSLIRNNIASPGKEHLNSCAIDVTSVDSNYITDGEGNIVGVNYKFSLKISYTVTSPSNYNKTFLLNYNQSYENKV
ncbi:hypothetical protein [Spiroplasma endosymbiont of Amphibalanus improvisus]|uniref:hypothetical protein n=1 Tax=Spiroplasma endosymbiont of Amphibalanus improvisus TaxID=3066327 RepID=UPI00313C01E1